MPWNPDYVVMADAKKWVRISDTIDDAELAVIVTAASRGVDDHCNRQFGKTDGAQERLYTAWFDDERWRWIVPVDDFMTAVGLVVTIGGAVTTEYTKEPVNAAQELKPWTHLSIDRRTASVVPTGADFEIGVTSNPWGWTAIPPTVSLAVRLQVNRFLSRRDAPFGIAGSAESALRLLSHLDPDVAVSLRGLVRPRKVG